MTWEEYKEKVQKGFGSLKLIDLIRLDEFMQERNMHVTEYGMKLMYELTGGLVRPDTVYAPMEIFSYLLVTSEEGNYGVELSFPLVNLASIFSLEEGDSLPESFNFFEGYSMKYVEQVKNNLESLKKEGKISKYLNHALMVTPKPMQLLVYLLNKDCELYSKEPDTQVDNLIHIYTVIEYGFTGDEENIFLPHLKEIKPLITKGSDYHPSQIEGYGKEKITIYRGHGSRSSKLSDNPLSWTTDYDVAKYFATRFDSTGTVFTGQVEPKHIIAYNDSRNESEVIVESYDVEVVSEEICSAE